VPIGSLTGSSAGKFENHQLSGRIDHQLGSKDSLGGRYMYNDSLQSGTGQVTPPGLTTLNPRSSTRSPGGGPASSAGTW
jgi:hypothetical protein